MDVAANGIRVNCRITGTGGPWVVFSHSLSCNLAMWEEQVRLLAGRFRVLCYDTRGHGGSEATAGAYSLDLLAGDLVALLDALCIERAHLVGLSMGGMIAQTAALANPQRFAALVLADTTSRYPPEFAAVWEERIRVATRGGMEAQVAPTLQRWFTPAFRQRRPELVAQVGDWIRSTPIDGFVGCCRALARIHTWPRLPEIRCPVLVMVGEQDPTTPVAMARDIHEAIAGSRLVRIPEAAHISNLEQPERFGRALGEFLDAVA